MQTKTQNKTAKQRYFSVELKSKSNLKNISISSSNQNENVLIEGTIGELTQASFDEGVILQVVGTQGTLRLDLTQKELRTAVPQTKQA